MKCRSRAGLRSVVLCLSVGCGALLVPSFVRAQGWGDVTGQIVFGGDVPAVKDLIKKGDPTAKDGEVCAKEAVPSEELVVAPATKGIAHVFVYLRSAPSVHPDLAKSTVPEIVFDQKGCRFLPHALVARTDQKVRVLSDDPVAHNTHTFPIKNNAVNFLLRPNERKGVPIENPTAEILPFQVKCDIHPWMMAYWLVVDHPYATVTNAKGEFRIAKLPAGEHEFRVWQEKVGYVERAYKVTVKAGETTALPPLVVPAAKFN
jgi:hypothetical protein